jgi:glycosyltransferase involved in cell wall biosynthesis
MKALVDMHHVGQQQTGNETWARNVGERLTLAPGQDEYEVLLTEAAPSDYLAGVPRRLVSGSSARRLIFDTPRIIRQGGYDVVLVQYTMPLTRTPCVVAIHDLSFEDPRAREWLPSATRRRYRATIGASARMARHVVALSEATKADLIFYFGLPEEKITVAHAAVDPLAFRRTARSPVRHDRPTVLVVGNVLPRKNIELVARAVALAQREQPDLQLVVLGSAPPEGMQIAGRIKSLLGDNVRFTGHVTPTELVEAYHRATMLAFPSLYEGFGIPILEAMAAQLPVICSNATSLPEVAGDAAIIVDAEDVEGWAAAIVELASSEALRDSLMAQGLRRCAAFSWDRTAETVREVLSQCSQ